MDNPQHYQPLSYALHPPTSTTPKPVGSAPPQNPQLDDDSEERLVADHLKPNEHVSDASTSKPVGTPTQEHQFLQEPDPGGKRRPGRPRGSKTRKVQSPPGQAPVNLDAAIASHPTGTGTAPPLLPNVTSQNQQYYEFQWRMLNLCAEFYGAAEELIKDAPPLVVAQCYQMGPGSKVDPLTILNEAKQICDTLLANPTQLILSPPPPLYPPTPAPAPAPATPAPATPAPTPTPAPVLAPPPPPSAVITNPQSFVVSLGTQPGYSYAGYAPPQYPGPYYAPYGYAPGYYPPPAQSHPQSQQPPPQPQAQPQQQPQQLTVKPQPPPPKASTSTPKPPSSGGTQGPWSEAEVERLKKFAEDSKASSASKEIEWDWVVGQFGPGRTRHQILVKATSLGLKESGRGNKRRREVDDSATSGSPAPPNPAAVNSKRPASTSTPSNATGSPAMSHTTATPLASPAMSHLQRPPSAKGHAAPAKPPTAPPASGLPWPMPTVAAANVSPVLSPSVQGEPRTTTSYYRPRPPATDASSAAPQATTHQFRYQNGPVQNGPS
ncbi:hypothetical protein DFH06DRAFT_1082092 [Mycena polygramma]|nr:hypothetical protein DFH06DRAFT_1082092 [Mycena polygramma]